MLIAKLEMASVIVAIAIFGSGPSVAQTPAPKKITANTLQQESLGELPPGKWNMKSTMLVMEPGSEVPFHVHKGPGLRYVLEGAITINWKDGKIQTFKAGSTYFEGPGANHPAGTMAARNDGQGPCRVLIVELVPQE
jgi:quercetin dioxygenase-like cupin family protein